MSDILDALDAINGAEALVKEWEREFLHEWYRPALEAMVVQAARQISHVDPLTRMMLERKHPGGMAIVDELAHQHFGVSGKTPGLQGAAQRAAGMKNRMMHKNTGGV